MTFDQADRRYSYDRHADPASLRGLEKLRAFDDPRMRRNVYELWANTGGRIETPREHAEFHDAFEDNSEERYP